MANLSSPGLSSGIDIKALVGQLVSASAIGPTTRFDQQEARYQTEISGLGLLKGALSDFQSGLSGINNPDTYGITKASNNQKTLFSVAPTTDSIPGSYSVEVKTLAASQKLASKLFADTTTALGTGSLQFRFGTYDSGANTFTANESKSLQTVTIDTDDNSLQGIRDAVNESDIGITASIVNDGTGNYLIFSSNDTGLKNSLEVTVLNDSVGDNIDDSGLSQLAFDPTAAGVGTGKNLTQNIAAADATLNIDGIAITSDSNTVTGAIQDTTLNLLSAELNTTATVVISQDKDTIANSVKKFVDAYNKLIDVTTNLSKYDPETKQAGILLGDSTLRNITSQIRRVIYDSVDGITGAYDSLVSLGIKTDDSNKLQLDTAKLTAALDAGVNNVAKVFSSIGEASDSLVNVTSFGELTEVGSYAVDITQMATKGLYTGSVPAAPSFIIDTNNNTFTIKVDGKTSGTITLGQKDYVDGATLASELQSQINIDSILNGAGVSVNVVYNVDRFEITSQSFGSDSKVTIESVDTNTESQLGLSTTLGTSTDGLNVAGSIGGFTASGNGQVLTGSNKAAELALTINGGTTGSRGMVDFTRGITGSLSVLLENILGSESIITSRTTSLSSRIEEINDGREALGLRLETLEARYLAQFNAMDQLVAQLQSSGEFLLTQLNNLPLSNNNKK